ncbi:hypothetical protein [Rhodanobacter panaciterrae]|uniref:hypothetical protein n=1 Tax=Rhodanobacter panaciterrae TaxID=490572 RepID=UPI00167875FF|nr:hypothetical protein [Rhodanobacter panaciterrae]
MSRRAFLGEGQQHISGPGGIMFRDSLLAMAVALFCLSTTAVCQEAATQAPGWDPSEFQLDKDGPCSFELGAASSLIKIRDSGQSREKVISTLPPRGQSDSNPSVSTMYSVLDDIYGNPTVARFPYFAYRNITCMRRHMGKPIPPNFSSVAPQVMACQSKFGMEASDHLISCIQAAVEGKAP